MGGMLQESPGAAASTADEVSAAAQVMKAFNSVALHEAGEGTMLQCAETALIS